MQQQRVRMLKRMDWRAIVSKLAVDQVSWICRFQSYIIDAADIIDHDVHAYVARVSM